MLLTLVNADIKLRRYVEVLNVVFAFRSSTAANAGPFISMFPMCWLRKRNFEQIERQLWAFAQLQTDADFCLWLVDLITGSGNSAIKLPP